MCWLCAAAIARRRPAAHPETGTGGPTREPLPPAPVPVTGLSAGAPPEPAAAATAP